MKDPLEQWAVCQIEELSAVSLQEMNSMVEKLYSLKDEIAVLEDQVKTKNEEFRKIEARVLNLLEATGQNSYECASGKIVKTKRSSVKQPQTPEAKAAFYEWLKAKGDFENLISVNSRTLTSYVKKEIEALEEEGKFGFVPPGLEAPETVHYLSLKRK